MFLQAVPPPIPPPPPPGLPLENEIILLIFGIVYGIIVLSRRKIKMKKSIVSIEKKTTALRILYSNTEWSHSSNKTCNLSKIA